MIVWSQKITHLTKAKILKVLNNRNQKKIRWDIKILEGFHTNLKLVVKFQSSKFPPILTQIQTRTITLFHIYHKFRSIKLCRQINLSQQWNKWENLTKNWKMLMIKMNNHNILKVPRPLQLLIALVLLGLRMLHFQVTRCSSLTLYYAIH